MHTKRRAVTLAEMLVALVIIGTLAALTIPLITKQGENNKNIYVAGLKKAYAELYTATEMIMAESGGIMPQFYTSPTEDSLMDDYCEVLKCRKKCTDGNDAGVCFHNGASSLKTLAGDDFWMNPNDLARFITKNGTLVAVYVGGSNQVNYNGENCRIGTFYVDINGFKGPNIWGRDIFELQITKYGLFPKGSVYDTVQNDHDIFCNTASSNIYNGVSCAAKVLDEGAMSY